MDILNRKPWIFWLLLIALPPAGLFVLFKTKKFNRPLRALLTVAFSFLFVFQIAFAFADPAPTDPAKQASTSDIGSDQVANQEKTSSGADATQTSTEKVTGKLKVHYLDVGQADSILVQSPSETNILIDGGNNEDGPGIVDYLKAQGITKLDAVIATHPHEDHIGGLDTVIKAIPTKAVYMPNASTTTQTYQDFIAAVNASGAKKIQAKAGAKLDVAGFTGTFLAPVGTKYDDLNNYSAVLRLTFGSTSFLFTGDAENISENEMLKAGDVLKADVLKVGHHGSDSSTTDAFLKAVAPKIAVISVGKGNSYGHPAAATINKLTAAGAKIYRTDQDGTIILTSDGKTIAMDKGASPIKENAPPASSGSGSSASGSGSSPSASSPSTPAAAPSSNAQSSAPSVSGPSTAAPPTVTPAPPQQETKDITVYITDTGEKYHRDGCRYLKKSQIPISLGQAQAEGYTPCSVCDPPQ